MDTALTTLITALGAGSVLHSRIGPDHLAEVFTQFDTPQPVVFSDDAIAPADSCPQGLLVWLGEARKAGIDRVSFTLIHPTLPLAVPKVGKDFRRPLARARAAVIFEHGNVSRAVGVIDEEARLVVGRTAEVPYTPLHTVSVPEAASRLRRTVMAGLEMVEAMPGIPADLANLQWRDWQADMATAALSSELGTLLIDPNAAPLLLTALEIHEAFSSVLAPRSLQPAEFGALLAELHQAAAGVVTAVCRANIG